MSDGEFQIIPQETYEGYIKSKGEGVQGTDMITVAKDLNIKDLVVGNSVIFNHFRQGYFYYDIVQPDDDGEVLQFPVPLDDIGTATMKHIDKAITYMRWIRKAIEDKTLVKI